MKIYHNPRCGKSRAALNILTDEGLSPEIIFYMKDIPSVKTLTSLLKKLKVSAADFVRKGEPIYKDKFLGKKLSEEEWIKAMIAYPQLIERPIIVDGRKAILARPPEKASTFIKPK